MAENRITLSESSVKNLIPKKRVMKWRRFVYPFSDAVLRRVALKPLLSANSI